MQLCVQGAEPLKPAAVPSAFFPKKNGANVENALFKHLVFPASFCLSLAQQQFYTGGLTEETVCVQMIRVIQPAGEIKPRIVLHAGS